jgi:hypothetical protein
MPEKQSLEAPFSPIKFLREFAQPVPKHVILIALSPGIPFLALPSNAEHGFAVTSPSIVSKVASASPDIQNMGNVARNPIRTPTHVSDWDRLVSVRLDHSRVGQSQSFKRLHHAQFPFLGPRQVFDDNVIVHLFLYFFGSGVLAS